MDPYTEKLVERTMQRREMLNQKLRKTPDPAPRKRFLEENTSHNIQPAVVEDDSPKRQRVSGQEKPKPDTPAIAGVKSRMQQLSENRTVWSDTEPTAPVQAPADHSSQPSGPAASPTNRKSRFANLAKNINSWEDDLSHPTIQKVVEKKPRWQPPKKTEDRVQGAVSADARDRHVSAPQKEYELYQGPKRLQGDRDRHTSAPSPKTKEAPPPPEAPPSPEEAAEAGPRKPPRCPSPSPLLHSPKKYQAPAPPKGSPIRSVASPGRFQHQVRQQTDKVPVNARGWNNSGPREQDEDQDPTSKPINERLATWKKAADTPSKGDKPSEPSQSSVSSRMSSWEQKISNTPKAATLTKGVSTPRQTFKPATPAVEVYVEADTKPTDPEPEGDPAARPVSDRLAGWQKQDAVNNPPKDEEPTAYSVNARMSAWEVMSSSNKVSYIKKVEPGKSPKHSPVHFKPGGTPNKPGITPKKSFKESIEERAAQMRQGPQASGASLPPRPPSTQSPGKKPDAAQSPGRSSRSSPQRTSQLSPKQISPARVGSATKTLQQRLIQKTQHSKTDQLAEKLRRERMAEVSALQNRFQNGLIRDDKTTSESESEPVPEIPNQSLAKKLEKRETIKLKARADFDKKLAAMGFEVSNEGATFAFNKNGQEEKGNGSSQAPPPPPPPPQTQLPARQGSSAGQKTGSSIYRLVSQKCPEAERPVVRTQSSASMKKVTFKDGNVSTETESDRYTESGEELDETDDFDGTSEGTQSETQESDLSSNQESSFESEADSSIPESYKGPAESHDYQRPPQRPPPPRQVMDEGDDVSLSAFVPASVRHQSVMPSRPEHGDISSEDSFEDRKGPGYGGSHRSVSNLQALAQQGTSSRGRQYDQETDDSEDEDENQEGIDDLLDEALDEVSEVEMRHPRKNEPAPIPRKRRSHMMATTAGEMNLPMTGEADGLAYSVSMYRSKRSTTIQTTVNFTQMKEEDECKQRISRNSRYASEDVVEEDIQMPTELPLDVQRKTIKERIKELQELVSQEQSVIMQTSNALNKCCSGDSMFAGSAEQVECNRLLLVSCQKRQAYLTEVQRLKDSGRLESDSQAGPKGSLTISDIRLPLKKEFVTKIGTGQDNTVHYFVLLIRNGSQVIFTQMLSTHDPMMRGSLDFPNLIKIHGISGRFSLPMDIYSMSVSKEHIKDKKRKTPKKHKGLTLQMESPGGPTAVRTTSFTLITTLQLTMKCLDKSSFTLERIPYLSPLHGTIYMRLKCMMEQNVEERGFLTMFEDVSGLGAWHRRWCGLTGNKLCFWKYPDDETRKDPMGFVDLKRCITEKIGLIPRDICARPHTFELVSVRPPRRGEQDTLVTKTYNTMTTTKHMLSADTKEERIVWCNKINRALANIRTWHADALRPIKPK